jgi:membrane-bound lytic murein transglycosylase A
MAIERGALGDRLFPLVWLRDKVETFFIHVQGSARVKLRDGSELRLTYAGRNGHPYTSIGRVLIEQEKIPPEEAGMAGLKQWIRAKGQNPGEPGEALMLRNKSYIFFSASDVLHRQEGPIGGQGISLAPLRSMAVDRGIWAYGLPMWIEAEIPWRCSSVEKFRRLLIAQDTGSAIVGSARGDLFFGSGDGAGALAGALRHPAAFTVLLPRNANQLS